MRKKIKIAAKSLCIFNSADPFESSKMFQNPGFSFGNLENFEPYKVFLKAYLRCNSCKFYPIKDFQELLGGHSMPENAKQL